MKANVITAHGPARSVFSIQQVPDPIPAGTDLVLQVSTTSINPLDCRIRAKASVPRTFPLTLGFDVCGTVVAKGAAVTGFDIGDRVLGSPSPFRPGASAEFVAIDYRACTRAHSLDDAVAAAIPLVGITAYEALFERLCIQPDDWVVIHAGAGGVGHLAVQLAKQSGCKVITTAGRPESIAYCEAELGADYVLNYHTTDLTAAIMDITEGHGVRTVLDAVGGATFSQCLDYTAPGGHICTILPVPVDEREGYRLLLKNITLSYQFMTPLSQRPEDNCQGKILEKLVGMVESGALRPHVSKVYDWHDLACGHEEMERGHVMGKLVVRVTD